MNSPYTSNSQWLTTTKALSYCAFFSFKSHAHYGRAQCYLPNSIQADRISRILSRMLDISS